MPFTKKPIGDGTTANVGFTAGYQASSTGAIVPAPAPSGLGAVATVPAGTTNGASLGTAPEGSVGVRFYLKAADSVTYTIAAAAPSSAPTTTITVSGQSNQTGDTNWDEQLTVDVAIYVTATSGTPRFRFM